MRPTPFMVAIRAQLGTKSAFQNKDISRVTKTTPSYDLQALVVAKLRLSNQPHGRSTEINQNTL